jgi:hypothetical protein
MFASSTPKVVASLLVGDDSESPITAVSEIRFFEEPVFNRFGAASSNDGDFSRKWAVDDIPDFCRSWGSLTSLAVGYTSTFLSLY